MFFWLIRGHGTEGLRWYQQTLDLPSLSRTAETRILLGMAHMWYTQGELGRARTGLTRALALAHDAGSREMIAQAEHLFGHVEHALGNDPAARERFTRSVDGFRSLAIPWGIGSGLSGMAWVALATGDVDEAERLLDEAAPVLRDAGPWFLLLPLYLRAILAVRRGSPDAAIALVRRSLGYIRELHDRFALVYALVPLEAAAALKGDDTWAARILGIRHAVTERTGARFVDTSVDDVREQAERKVRARLDPDRWERAYAAGRVTSIDSLIKDIDNVLSRNRAPA
jgi:ATP/maltotriose-dependent transcriptional regulator MalT